MSQNKPGQELVPHSEAPGHLAASLVESGIRLPKHLQGRGLQLCIDPNGVATVCYPDPASDDGVITETFSRVAPGTRDRVGAEIERHKPTLGSTEIIFDAQMVCYLQPDGRVSPTSLGFQYVMGPRHGYNTTSCWVPYVQPSLEQPGAVAAAQALESE